MTGLASAVRARVGNLLLCSLLLCGLAACGSGSSGSSNAPTASAGNVSSSVSLVSSRVGTINRGPTSVATPPQTASSTPTRTTSTASTQPVITCVKGIDGSATLDWTPPTQNSDGTSLTNLAGYTGYYGTSPSNLNQSVKLTNPGLTAYTVSNLAPGTWYFAIASYSSDGTESTPSGVVSTTI